MRRALHRLRLTWTEVFPRGKLYGVDVKINELDKKWPVALPPAGATATTSAAAPLVTVRPPATTSARPSPASDSAGMDSIGGQMVHVNPKFINKSKLPANGTAPQTTRSEPTVVPGTVSVTASKQPLVRVLPLRLSFIVSSVAEYSVFQILRKDKSVYSVAIASAVCHQSIASFEALSVTTAPQITRSEPTVVPGTVSGNDGTVSEWE